MISLKKVLYPRGISTIYFIIIFVVSIVLLVCIFFFKSTCLVLFLI